MNCIKLYSVRKSYADDDVYWYNKATVLAMPMFPSVFLEIHDSYDEGTNITRKGYTIIKADEIPKPGRTQGFDDIVVEIEPESGEMEIKPEELENFTRKSWVGGTVVIVNSCLDLWNHPELKENSQGRNKK